MTIAAADGAKLSSVNALPCASRGVFEFWLTR
jgi:hypothetical protein